MYTKIIILGTLGVLVGSALAIWSWNQPTAISTPVEVPEAVSTSTPATTTSDTPAPSPAPLPKPTTSPAALTPFSVATSLAVGGNLAFQDGLVVTLKTIADSRCKPDVQCIWAGELAPEFSVTGGSFGKAVFMVSLGTVRSTTTTAYAYTFSLGTVSLNEATIIVTKASVTKTGTVQGTVTVSPVCPVERIDTPCVVPPETYTSRKVVAYDAQGVRVIKELSLKGDGSYVLTLEPGTYLLQIVPAGIGEGEKKSIGIIANTTSTVDFAIDSGIR